MVLKIKNFSKIHSGFTLVELMVVIVIIGILVAVAMPNFISAQDRAKISNVKVNMHSIQLAAETYSVDNGGKYPDDLNMLQLEGTSKNYWRDFKNPFNGLSGPGNSYIGAAITSESELNKAGIIGYQPSFQNGLNVTYFLYGAGKDAGIFIKDGSSDFYLTQR